MLLTTKDNADYLHPVILFNAGGLWSKLPVELDYHFLAAEFQLPKEKGDSALMMACLLNPVQNKPHEHDLRANNLNFG